PFPPCTLSKPPTSKPTCPFMISWIEYFQCSRMQSIKINKSLSDCKPVLSGIPQGSVLGPVLFVIYINDMPLECLNSCDSFLFADDAKLYKQILCDSDSLVLNQCCQNVFQWCSKWLINVKINVS